MTKSLDRRKPAYLVAAAVLFELLIFIFGPFGMPKGKTPTDFLFLLLVLFHGLWAYRLFAADRRLHLRALFRTPEVLMSLTLVLFLLSYIFASNANMSYIQRFAASHGNVRLAPNSTIQRLNSALEFVPLLLAQAWAIAYYRLKRPRAAARVVGNRSLAAVWAMPLVLAGVVLYALAFPSFFVVGGVGPLAFIALVPLFIVLYRLPGRWGLFYGVTFGVLQTMITNFWLGTFSLVSLQFITVVMIIEYTIFMALLLWLLRRLRTLGYLLLPLAWVGFDYLRSIGFLGYPWGMLGTTQYGFTAFIQVASLTGVWGVTFAMIFINAAIAHLASSKRPRSAPALVPLGAALLLFAALTTGGAVAIRAVNARPVSGHVRVALVQQNTDPRKNDYGDTFQVLKRLTNAAIASHPDLVAWSETAFVPNISKWSKLDPKVNPLSALVDQFLAYQKGLGTWLLTGNDDYTEVAGANGQLDRYDYNAAELFSPEGVRTQIYHKIHLVPFTEYFPYKKQLPMVYNMLTNFDVYLWEPGTEYTVFRIPQATFSTPICFEDAFPDDVRHFVLAGAQIIMNISNDYWSLTPVEGMQHFMNSLFRAVENRKPLLRSTASGVTAYVDPTGRLVARLPFYEPAYLDVNVALHAPHETLYTRYGDWLPKLAILVFVILLFVSYSPTVRSVTARGRERFR